jgi:hypothetical protein
MLQLPSDQLVSEILCSRVRDDHCVHLQKGGAIYSSLCPLSVYFAQFLCSYILLSFPCDPLNESEFLYEYKEDLQVLFAFVLRIAGYLFLLSLVANRNGI